MQISVFWVITITKGTKLSKKAIKLVSYEQWHGNYYNFFVIASLVVQESGRMGNLEIRNIRDGESKKKSSRFLYC